MASSPFWILPHRLEENRLSFKSFVMNQKCLREEFHVSKVNFKDCSISIEFLNITLFLGFIYWQESPKEKSLIALSLEEYVKLPKALEKVIHTVFQPIWKMSTLRYDSLLWWHSNVNGDYKLNFQWKISDEWRDRIRR